MRQMINSVKWFKGLDNVSIRAMTLKLYKKVVYQKNPVISFREMCEEMYFIMEGKVNVFVYDTEWDVKYKFQELGPGCSFNIVTCVMAHESNFIFEAKENCKFMVLSKTELQEAANQNLLL